MPEIVSLNLLPAEPAAPIGPAAPVTIQPGDPSPAGADFLGQLKSALATLASAAMPGMAAQLSVDRPQAHEPGQVADVGQTHHTADDQSKGLPEALATLGFILVPTTFQPIVAAEPNPTPDSTATQSNAALPGVANLSAAATALPQIAPAAAQSNSDLANGAPSGEAEPGLAARAQLEALPQTGLDNQPRLPQSTEPQHHQGPDLNQPSTVQAAVPAVTPLNAESTNTQQILASGAPDAVASQAAPAAHQSATPVPVASPQTPIVNAHPSAHQGGFDHGTDAEGRQSTANQTASTAASTSTQSAPATDQSFAASAAAAATSTTSGAAMPAHLRPTEVVNQIAHQAELYRLPGNRGVRIQLHPEDLGGVDVTLRYSNTGGIELHINVEHAATGALVQSGWTELRDALATQGITPDRLVLSISGPSDAGHLDFSSGNGSRPDPGLSFHQGNQDQAGQQGQRGQEARLSQGWNGGPEPTLSTDELPRSAATAASSRIDYRV